MDRYIPIVSSTSAFRRALALKGREALRLLGLAKVLLVLRSCCLSILDVRKQHVVHNGADCVSVRRTKFEEVSLTSSLIPIECRLIGREPRTPRRR
jgi:hypothetical protein